MLSEPMRELKDISSNFTGQVIESAFQDALVGLRSESLRVEGCQYILIEFRQEYDLDGLTEYVEILEGFLNEESACEYVDQALAASLARVLPGNYSDAYRWQVDKSRLDQRFKAKKESGCAKGGYLRSFRATNGSGLDIVYLQLEVVHVICKPILGIEVFSFYDASSEWISYLIEKGREAKKVGGSGSTKATH
jgi:hypothetical protein